MKFLSRLFGRSTENVTPNHDAIKAVAASTPIPDPLERSGKSKVAAAKPAQEVPAKSSNNIDSVKAKAVNIWDMDDVASTEKSDDAPAKNRRRRNATRVLGFDHSEEALAETFDKSATPAASGAVQFPTGWLCIVAGEGRGHCFGLEVGLNQVGRGDENAIRIDFGDAAISRQNHFAVVYDAQERSFILGHGGKSNIVRLNGKAIASNETLKDGDKIKVGDTVLQLKTLCGADFDWDDTDSGEGSDNVAIA